MTRSPTIYCKDSMDRVEQMAKCRQKMVDRFKYIVIKYTSCKIVGYHKTLQTAERFIEISPKGSVLIIKPIHELIFRIKEK